MSAREELAAVLAEEGWYCGPGEHIDDELPAMGECSECDRLRLDLADALLAPPALARVIREAKADGWTTGYLRGVLDECQDLQPADNPYRDQTEEPT